jgi:hypothetical protein
MSTVQEQLKESVRILAQLEESEIETELGRRLAATRDELDQADSLSAASVTTVEPDRSELAAAPVWLKELAEEFLRRLNDQMYRLVCDERDPDNARVRQFAGAGVEQLGFVLAGVLVASFGLLPGVAAALGVILAKRITIAGHQALCTTWRPSKKDS